NGVVPCGKDLMKTWPTFYEDATVAARGLYFPEKQQVHWWVAFQDGNNLPTRRLVLHHTLMRMSPEGSRGGFAIWGGSSFSGVFAVCMYSDNIDSGGPRSRYLKPFVAFEGKGLIWRTDVGTTDNGTAYAARLKTKPYGRGGMLDAFEVGETLLLAKGSASRIDVQVTGSRSDKSAVTRIVPNVN